MLVSALFRGTTAVVLSAPLFLGSLAHAQNAPPGPSEMATSVELSEVVVTAQRRSERIQDVPITVEAISADVLQTAGVWSIRDLPMVVPGLQIGDSVGFATPHLRGVGSTTLAPGVEMPIAIYVDGVYYASATSSLFDLIDADNVEVLKGPQGTLFGRNATGGVIQVTTKQPSQTPELDADLGYGNYQTVNGDVRLTGGLAHDLAASLAVKASVAGEGYGTNLLTGDNVYRNDLTFGVRTKWLWTPSDATSITAAADYSHRRDSDIASQIPRGASNLPGETVPAYGSPWDTSANFDPVNRNLAGGVSLRLDQELGFAKLMDIVAYRKDATTMHWDIYQGVPLYFDGLPDTAESQFSEEVQLSSVASSPVSWTAGLYYFHSDAAYDPNRAIFGPPALNFIGEIVEPDEQHANSVAGYAQATIPILLKTNLTLGVRYTNENHNISGAETLYLTNGALLMNTNYPERTAQFAKPTYRVALDHHLAAATMIYASFNTGFKSGGFNTGAIFDPAYGSETLTAYEVGIKTDLLERRLRVDLSGYHYNYTNIQVQRIEGLATGIINGGAARLDGADLDLRVAAARGLTVDVSAEYLNAHFTSFPNAPLSNPDLALTTEVQTGSAAGNDLPYASHVTYTLSGNYSLPLRGNELNFNVTVDHVSGFAIEPDNVVQQPGCTRLNTSLEWQPIDHRYSVKLWGRNLTNEALISYGATLVDGLHTVSYEPPRTYGITLGYHFK